MSSAESSGAQRSRLPSRPTLSHDHPASRLDRVTLLSHALWSIAAEHLGLTDEDLLARMVELDESDGVRDQKVSAPPQRCSCGAAVSAKPGWCWMCGQTGNFSPFTSI